jgi:hypothetical protein
MHETMLKISYESLGKILRQIQESAEVKGSPVLAERVSDAISFHQQMAAELQSLNQEQQLLKQKLSDVTREPGERICYEPSPERFLKYEKMGNAGATPQEVYSAAIADGLSRLEGILALRQIFELHLPDAKEVVGQVETQFHKQAA